MNVPFLQTPGEDPLLSGIVGQLYTAAGQGDVKALNWSAAPDGGPPLKTAWSIKHYLAYDVECSSGGAGAHFALTNIDNTRAGAGKGFDCQGANKLRCVASQNMLLKVLISPHQLVELNVDAKSFRLAYGQPLASTDFT